MTEIISWLTSLSLFEMALAVFGFIYVIAGTIFFAVTRLATGERASVFKNLSPAMLSPLGAAFALLMVFTADPVWKNYDEVKHSIGTEATGLRDALILSKTMPQETDAELRRLIRNYVTSAVEHEWPAMAENRVQAMTHRVCACSQELLAAVDFARNLRFQDEELRARKGEIIDALNKVREARRGRILVSEDKAVNFRLLGLMVIGSCLLTWIALTHSGDRRACAIALTLFATVMGTSNFLILSYANPFRGEHGLGSMILEEAAN